MSISNLRTKIEAICDAKPDHVNPSLQGGGGCLYTSPFNDEPSHCLIGQLAADEGWTVPDSDYWGSASMAASDFGWPVDSKEQTYLTYVQEVADGTWSKLASRGVVKWGDVKGHLDDVERFLVDMGHSLD